MTAEMILMELESMPIVERDRFFSMLGRCFFKDENLSLPVLLDGTRCLQLKF